MPLNNEIWVDVYKPFRTLGHTDFELKAFAESLKDTGATFGFKGVPDKRQNIYDLINVSNHFQNTS
jgi:hypothetical protein